ncbi:MAG: Hsp70 family protein [Myxococcales bacterium]|nr:Hsp70 family protein [Myxococcales bacterium]
MFVDRPVGIDLGTTNSEIAILDPSERDLLVYADELGRRTIPSAVAWDDATSSLLVGRPARLRRGRSPGPVESIKRQMGQHATVAVGPRAMSPEEVSAAILAELRRLMLAHLRAGAPSEIEIRLARAVITVPAYFDAPQMEATRRAGELAGLEVLGLLQEPTAAAIYHSWKNELGAPPGEGRNFLVYDLGGGTFDVSILRQLGGEYQVLAIDGDNYLGGDDFDRRFAEKLRQKLVARGYALDLKVRERPEDAERFLRLVHLAQELKESLSTRDVVHLSKEALFDDQRGQPVSFEDEIGRAEYDAATADLVATTLRCCERALARSAEVAGVGPTDIDHVVLVGGSTRVPAVVAAVTEHLCGPARCERPLQEEVDTCVALGAAVHAAQLGGLRVGDERAVVSFLSPLVAKGPVLKLALEVEQGPAGCSELAVSDAEGALVTSPVAELPTGRVRVEVPLTDEPEQRLSFELYGDADEPLASLPFALYRGDVRPRASSLSKPSVVAKDLSLEVVKAGRRERRVLIPRGTGLPTEVQHRFYTADQSGAVVLRLLQNRLPIKTLVVSVPEGTEVGAPVDLTLRCDETMRLEAKAKVAGQELWAQIEPASLAPPESTEALDRLIEQAEEISRRLWGREGQAYRRELEPLTVGLREAASTDPAKAAALSARLQLLVDEFRDASGEGLTPPLRRFEELVDRVRRVVFRAGGGMLGMDLPAWEERIDRLTRRGQQAWDDLDGAEWRRAYNEAQALYETASEQEFAGKRVDDPEVLQRRLGNLTVWASLLEGQLRDFVPSAAEEVRALQVGERDRLLGVLFENVRAPLDTLGSGTASDIRRGLDQVGAELERLELAFERLPQIGLVTDR